MEYAFIGHEGFIGAVEPRLAAAGFERVAEVSAAEVVLTYCTSQTALEDAYFDSEGVVATAVPGTKLIDLSASTPSFAREVSAVAMVSDLSFVEAPLVVLDSTLEDAFAQAENLACFAAGEKDDVEAAAPVLNALVGAVHDTGGTGAAQLARAAYTLQNTAQLVSAVEADALYRAVRRSPSEVAGGQMGNAGAITSAGGQVLAAVAEERFNGTYTIEMFMAELSAALMAADDVDLILPQAEACMHLLELLAVIGGSDKAPASLSLVYGEESECAKNGLDWTRAEEAYGEDDCDCDDDCDCGCGHDHGHGHGSYDGFGYSAN